MTSPTLVQVHRWVALTLGALIVIIGATGAALVFRDELTAFFTRAVAIDPAPVAPGQYERVFAAVRKADPDARSIDIVPSSRRDRAFEVSIEDASGGRDLFVDPHDGRIVADSTREWLPFAAFFRIHKRLMAGEAGEYVVVAAGFALVFLAATGLVLWWPRKLKYAFRIRLRGDPLAVSFDLHRSIGAALAVPLFVNAVIGISMNLDSSSPALVNRLALSPDAPIPPRATSNALSAARPLDEIVAAADRAMPGGAVTRIAIRNGDAPVVVRKVLAGETATHGMNRIYVDAASATVLHASALASLPPGSAMFEWTYPLHTGKLVGLPYRVLLVFAGLVPLLSLGTGLIMWRLRGAKRRTASAKPQGATRGTTSQSLG